MIPKKADKRGVRGCWGGSEELWSRTATLLAREGFNVAASVGRGRPQHSRASDLISESITARRFASHAMRSARTQ
jgi:hypothetical protein